MPTSHPGPTPHRPPLHTHPQYQLWKCMCVTVCLYTCVCMPPGWGTNVTVPCQSFSVVPVTHTAGLQYCVGTFGSMSVMQTTSCLCNPRTETNEGFPGPYPLQHICQPILLSTCTSVFIRPVHFYRLSARIQRTIPSYPARSASVHQAARHVVISLS